jgi:hypothetical protein
MIRMRTLIISAIVTLAVMISAIAALALRLNHAARPHINVESSAPPHAEVRGATVLTIRGKIVQVNRARRLVVIEVPSVGKLTLLARKSQDLAAAKVGATVTVRYYEVATIRSKIPGEVVANGSLNEGIEISYRRKGSGASGVRRRGLVLSVVEIDEKHGTVTLKGADKAVERVRARNPKTLAGLKTGDALVVSRPRAIAMSFENE